MDIHITISEVHIHLDDAKTAGTISEQIEQGVFNAILLDQDANKVKSEIKPAPTPKNVSDDTYEKKGEQALSCNGKPMNKCAECGQDFEPKRSKTEKFCSDFCKRQYVKKYNREWARANKNKKENIPAESRQPEVKGKRELIIPSGMSGEELMKHLGKGAK